MGNNNQQESWEKYRNNELRGAAGALASLGFSLDEVQPHISGERYLMSGKKLVLVGSRTKDHLKVIIKVSSREEGIREIESERNARETLLHLRFAYYTFLSPEEILYIRHGGYLIFITAFIEQEKTFLEHDVRNQFNLALRAFKIQEGVHATTSSHARVIRNVFGIWGAEEYLSSFKEFKKISEGLYPGDEALRSALGRASLFLHDNAKTIEQYCGFLTHTDFVPHNIRVHGGEIYLLDHTSLRFGNKHEAMARFLNFMLLYNRPLESAFLQYMRENKTPEESLSLRLMRAYKIAFLLSFYVKSLERTSGDLNTLTRARIVLWTRALESVVGDESLADAVVEEYQLKRDSLRSPEEKRRQEKLH